ncbi:MAG TPA: hypothetical protein VJG83_02390 [archaeon]|nr:hypothetical protein [archaeon]
MGKITYNELPPNVKYAVDKILAHRKRYRVGSTVAVSSFGIPGAVAAQHAIAHLHPMAGVAAFSTAVILSGAHLGHTKAFNKESLNLHSELKKARQDPRLKQLFSNYPFAVVSLKGDLIGKKSSPTFLKFQVGRRRVISPYVSKSKRANWRKNIPL